LSVLEPGAPVSRGRFSTVSDEWINTLCEDQEGNLWVGAKNGLVRVLPRAFTVYTKKDGLAQDNVMSVIQDQRGIIWAASWSGGLNTLVDGRIVSGVFTNRLPSDLALSLGAGRDGALWLGLDYNHGLCRIQEGRLDHYGEGRIEAPAIAVVCEDRQGRLWLGSRTGLVWFRDGREAAHYTKKDGLAGDAVRAILENHEGKLWVGTVGGLSCFQDGQFTSFTTREGLGHDTVTALYEDAAHDLWIGTAGGGLSRLRAGKITTYGRSRGLFDDHIFEILEDRRGNLWLSSPRGIFRASKQDLDDPARKIICVAYDRSSGLLSTECNGVAKPAAWKDRDGHFWFATGKGLAEVDPETVPPRNERPPPVWIERVRAGRREFTPAAMLRIPPGLEGLEFHFTALSFTAPERNRFKYQLEGEDAGWVEGGRHRMASYRNLPPGRYRFRVIGCNNDGVWNEVGAEQALILLPQFWQTWWFRVAGWVLLAGGVSGAAVWSVRRKARRALELVQRQRALESDRARIAKDIHDDLGASLTRITLLSDSVRSHLGDTAKAGATLERIATIARDLTRAMEEIVWAVNPRHDRLDSLANYLETFAQDLLGAAGVVCRLDVPAHLPRRPLTSHVRHNLFLAFKEALHNVVKHSGATQVNITLVVEAGRFVLTVSDDGRGFMPADPNSAAAPCPVPARGNGLPNMRGRLKEAGGECEVTSKPNAGTQVRFTVPLTDADDRAVP
jgi:signal transduction histidine kinase